MLSTALQVGLPGTQEMVIVLLIGVFFLAIPVLLVALLVKHLTGTGPKTTNGSRNSNAKSKNSEANARRRRGNLTTD